MSSETLLPLPLPDIVHFPRTSCGCARRAPLPPAGPRPGRARGGRVLDRGGPAQARLGPGLRGQTRHLPAAVPPGACMDVEELPDGSVNILLLRRLPFELERELRGRALPPGAGPAGLRGPGSTSATAGIVAVREARSSTIVRARAGARRDLPAEPMRTSRRSAGQPVRRAGQPHRRRDSTCRRCASSSSSIESLPERGLSVLSILRSRQQVVDLLRPYRHLAGGSHLN